MKVAFCFSGHIRYINEAIKYWKPIIDKYDADVYGSFWNMSSDNLERVGNHHDDIEFQNKYNKYLFKKHFNPKKVEFENFEDFEKSTINIFKEELVIPREINKNDADETRKCYFLAMAYKIWKSNLLVSKDEKYDIIVRTRTDIHLEDFELKINDFLNVPKSIFLVDGNINSFGPADSFAFSKPEIMDYYSSLFLYLTRYLKDNVNLYPFENILRYHLNQRNIVISFLESRWFLYRYGNLAIGAPENQTFKYENVLDNVIKIDPKNNNKFLVSNKENFQYSSGYYKAFLDFNVWYEIPNNKLLISFNRKVDAIIDIKTIDNKSIYSTNFKFDNNSMFIITKENLFDLKNIIIKIRNIYGNLLYIKEMKLNESVL